MTKEAYFRLASDRDNCLVDWEDGVATKMTPAHGRHGLFILHLSQALKQGLVDRGQLFQEIFVDFGPKTYGVDVAILFMEHVDRYVDGRILGAPDVIVEVLSQDSLVRDRTDKFNNYCSFGVPWYWIGDPLGGSLEEYQHTPGGYLRTASGTTESPFEPRALQGVSVDLTQLMKPGFP